LATADNGGMAACRMLKQEQLLLVLRDNAIAST